MDDSKSSTHTETYNDLPPGCGIVRAVHFVSNTLRSDKALLPENHKAAVITHVDRENNVVDLVVFDYAFGIPARSVSDVPFDASASQIGTWHYPERVD